MGAPEISELKPGIFLAQGDDGAAQSGEGPDLLILNQPISDFAAFSRLWRHARYRICADGGANRLHDMFSGRQEEHRKEYLPDSIHGDLDSLRDDVRAYYAGQGVEVTQDPDQYSTDFGKTMQKLSSRGVAGGQRDVLILGTLAGRVDQGLGLLHEMVREEAKHDKVRLWLFSESGLSLILRSKRNAIQGLVSSGVFTENVGLVPVYGPAIISTRGLEWDVDEWHTHMGGQVSTSNHVKADTVYVETSAPILFTIERATLSAQNHK